MYYHVSCMSSGEQSYIYVVSGMVLLALLIYTESQELRGDNVMYYGVRRMIPGAIRV